MIANAAPPEEPHGWHALSATLALEELGVAAATGLDEDAVAERLRHYGPNSLPQAPRSGAWLRFALQFHNPLIYVLLGAGVITFWLETTSTPA